MSKHILDIKKKASPRRDVSMKRARLHMKPLFPVKQTRLKLRRRKMKAVFFVAGLFVMTGVFAGLGFLSQASQFAITEVQVTGTKDTSPSDIQSTVNTALGERILGLFSLRNMFLYSHAGVAERLLMDFPRLEKVSVSRSSLMAQAIQVVVTEREAFALWCDDTCYVLDDRGYIFAPHAGQNVQMEYRFHKGLIPHEPIVEQTFLQGRFLEMVSFIALLADQGNVVTDVFIESEKDFRLVFQDGWALRVSFDYVPEHIVRLLDLALAGDVVRDRKAELEYIDIRFGNRVYYKFKNDGAEAES